MAANPNLLFILTDQQRPDTLGCYGNNLIKTPNLDILARESSVFENAYVSQPICTPSRATIMTGLYPQAHGLITNSVPLKEETKTIAEMVSDEYSCGYYGKWHLGNELIPQHGFDQWVSMEGGYQSRHPGQEQISHFSDYHNFLVKHGFSPDTGLEGNRTFSREMAAGLPGEFTKANWLGLEAARFIKNNQDQPFVLYVSFLEPHMPYDGPLNDMYSRDQLGVGPQFLQKPPENASYRNRLFADYYMQSTFEGHDLSTESGWREMRARYWGNVTHVDRSVGTILCALEEFGLAENTIVVYTSDHGEMMGDHGMYNKMVMYEEAIRVPLVIRVPWFENQVKLAKGRISQIDLVPTLLELMQEEIPGELQGESRVSVLSGESTLSRNDVFVQMNGGHLPGSSRFESDVSEEEMKRIVGLPWRTVISADGWKLNLNSGDQCELYDLNTDLHELNNLYDYTEHRERIHYLTRKISDWQAQTGDENAQLPEVMS